MFAPDVGGSKQLFRPSSSEKENLSAAIAVGSSRRARRHPPGDPAAA